MLAPDPLTLPHTDSPNTDSPNTDNPAEAASKRNRLAEDWVTIWRSELAAMATDREAAEHLQVALAGWLAASAVMRAFERDGFADAAGSRARTDAAARPPAAPAASDAGDTIAALERRVAELERRITAISDPA